MQEFRPLGVGEVISFSWSVYKRRFGPLMAISLLLVGIPSLLQWLPGMGGVMALALLLTELVASAAVIWVAAAHCVDLRSSAAESIRAAWGKFGRLLGMWLLFGLGVAVVAVVMILIGTVILAVVSPAMIERLGDYASDPMSTPPRTLFPFLIWTFVMLLPAIALAISWWAAPTAVMVEDQGPFDSLRRSWQLILPHFPRALGALLLAAAVIVPPMVVLYLVVPQYLAALLASLWSVPLTAVIGTVLYLDLRARSEHLTPETLTEELTSSS